MLLTFQIIISIAVLLSSVPLGYFLAWLTREELVQGRLAFALLIPASAVLAVALLFLGIEPKLPMVFSLLFIFMVSIVCMLKSYDKKFTGA